MAPGVKKSYIKHFYDNLAKAITLLAKLDGDKIVVSVKEQIQLQPTLDVDLKFNQMLKEILIANNIDESILDEIIDFTISSA